MPEQPKLTAEEVFRSGMEAAKVIAERLKPYCHDLDEFFSMLEHAMLNNGQFRLLYSIVTGPGQKRT